MCFYYEKWKQTNRQTNNWEKILTELIATTIRTKAVTTAIATENPNIEKNKRKKELQQLQFKSVSVFEYKHDNDDDVDDEKVDDTRKRQWMYFFVFVIFVLIFLLLLFYCKLQPFLRYFVVKAVAIFCNRHARERGFNGKSRAGSC